MAEKKVTTIKPKEVKAITIKDPKTGEFKYLLDFNRDSVKWAERQGFKVQVLEDGMNMNAIDDIFFYSFHAHHSEITRADAAQILKDIGGMRPEMLERLVELYLVPFNTLLATEDSIKNAKLAVEL